MRRDHDQTTTVPPAGGQVALDSAGSPRSSRPTPELGRTHGRLRDALPPLLLALCLLPLTAACGGGAPVEEASATGDEPAITEDPTAADPAREIRYPGEDDPDSPTRSPTAPPAGEPAPGEASPADREARIYLVELGDGSDAAADDSFGCGDRLRAVEVPVPGAETTTSGRLREALTAVITAGREEGLYTAFDDAELTVERVEEVAGGDGLFRVDLDGELRLGGVCDHPRVRAQLEATARQIDGVDEIEVLVGGEPLDALLTGR